MNLMSYDLSKLPFQTLLRLISVAGSAVAFNSRFQLKRQIRH